MRTYSINAQHHPSLRVIEFLPIPLSKKRYEFEFNADNFFNIGNTRTKKFFI